MEELFGDIDKKGKHYIDFGQIMGNWEKFGRVINNEAESKRLKGYLERYYKDTKITKAILIKVMDFYINEG